MLINIPDLVLFTSAALMLNLTPGNDMMFVLGQSLRSGARTGIAASFGIATGSLVHLCLVALGLAAVLGRHPAVFEGIRYAGVAYLVWIAWKTLKASPIADAAEGLPRSVFSAWRDGTLVNLLNPKIIVFMFAFLPPFIRPENGSPLLQLFILGMIFNIGGTAINILVACSAGKIGKHLTSDERLAHWFRRASALIFIGLAARIAFEKR